MRTKITKLLAAVMILVMSLSMTAFAADSPSGTNVVGSMTGATDKDGKDISSRLAVRSVSDSSMSQYSDEASAIMTRAGLQRALGSDWNENMVTTDVRVIEKIGDGDVALPATVTFSMKGVTKGSTVFVLCYNAETGEWEKLPVVVGDGVVTVTLDRLPAMLAFVVDSTTVTGGVGSATSPKTSASVATMVALLGIGAMVAACGLKKRSVLR